MIKFGPVLTPRHFKSVASLLIAFGCSCSHVTVQSERSGQILIHANLIDPDTEKSFLGNVIVENGHVVSVSPGPVAPVFSGTVLQMEHQWLLPAFADLHIHSWGTSAPDGESREVLGPEKVSELYLKAGVTSVLDLGSDENTVFPFRESQRNQKDASTAQKGADFFCAGGIFGYHMSPESGNGSGGIKTPTQASEKVRAYILKRHPDVIKIITGEPGHGPDLSFATLKAAIQMAHFFSVKVVIHIGGWERAAVAIRAGADVITHLDDDAKIPQSLVRLMKKSGTISIPTASVQGDLYQISKHPDLLQDGLLKKLAGGALLNSYLHPEHFTERTQSWIEWQADDEENDLYSLQKLEAAGVEILTGSDSGNVGTFHGFSEHREMEWFVNAGIPLWKVLRGATTHAHAFVGKKVCLAVGCIADFVVLEKNPLESIQNTKAISRVMIHGRWAN